MCSRSVLKTLTESRIEVAITQKGDMGDIFSGVMKKNIFGQAPGLFAFFETAGGALGFTWEARLFHFLLVLLVVLKWRDKNLTD